MRVFVYKNLHKKCYSVRALEGPKKGRVIAWETNILLKNPEFVVSEAGRKRVLREKRKNVHAGIRGEWIGTSPFPAVNAGAQRVTYDPYRFNSFVECGNLKPVHEATLASCEPTGVWII